MECKVSITRATRAKSLCQVLFAEPSSTHQWPPYGTSSYPRRSAVCTCRIRSQASVARSSVVYYHPQTCGKIFLVSHCAERFAY